MINSQKIALEEKDGSLDKFELANSYLFDGNQSEENKNKAISWLHELAEDNDPKSQALLGLFYRNGEYVDKNINKSLELLEQSSKNGSIIAIKELGITYLNSENQFDIKQDVKKAIGFLEESGSLGDAESYLLLSYVYNYPENQFSINNSEISLNYCNKAIAILENNEKNDDTDKLDTYNKLVDAYILKNSILKNDKTIFQKMVGYLEKSIEFGNTEAILDIAESYYNAPNEIRDLEKAKYWYQKYAEMGNKYSNEMLIKIQSEQDQSINTHQKNKNIENNEITLGKKVYIIHKYMGVITDINNKTTTSTHTSPIYGSNSNGQTVVVDVSTSEYTRESSRLFLRNQYNEEFSILIPWDAGVSIGHEVTILKSEPKIKEKEPTMLHVFLFGSKIPDTGDYLAVHNRNTGLITYNAKLLLRLAFVNNSNLFFKFCISSAGRIIGLGGPFVFLAIAYFAKGFWSFLAFIVAVFCIFVSYNLFTADHKVLKTQDDYAKSLNKFLED